MNTAIAPIMNNLDTFDNYTLLPEELDELYLYYVAVSRARYNVINAKYL